MPDIDGRTMAQRVTGLIREYKEKFTLEHLTMIAGIRIADQIIISKKDC